ncbi:MAG TPA: NAD-dependent epimerase/dehydratase family protein [Tabrizicola sp.]|nr:NAD-dependent epimerase/dehydratase family protein [Tabrizicola sp.]
MRVLVLGGCGFIGSHVVDQLVANNHDVRVLARRPEAARPPVPGVEYVWGDLRDAAQVSQAVVGCDSVVHLVSATTSASGDRDPQFDVEQNLLTTLSLLDVLAKADVRRLVYLSSGGTVYGPTTVVPTSETHPLRPIGSYGIVKVAVEGYIQSFARTRGLKPIIIRPSNAYGERQGRNGADGSVSVLLRRALTGDPFEIWGDGSVVRDYLHVTDLARLCVLSAESSVTGIFNAGTGVGTSLRALVDLAAEVTGRKIQVRYAAARSVDAPVNILDIGAARDALGWSPEITLRKGLGRTWDWLLRHPPETD